MPTFMNSWTAKDHGRVRVNRKPREAAGRAGSFIFSAPGIIFLSL
ncbi:hypothetical protein [Streptomyces oryzae]|nr:hypothetical protein [Streptomyces oryzae]